MRKQTPFLPKRALRWKLRVGPEDTSSRRAGIDEFLRYQTVSIIDPR
jgi:hypothetical protein